MKLVGYRRPTLVPSVTNFITQSDREPQTAKPTDPEATAPASAPLGLALFLEPDLEYRLLGPWQKLAPLSLAQIGAYCRIAIVCGAPLEAVKLAVDITRSADTIGRTRPVILRYLFTSPMQDEKELKSCAEEFDGFFIPAETSDDPAISFERTRRRVNKLVDASIQSGWTKAPKICLQPKGDLWIDRIPDGLAEFLLVQTPTKREYPAQKIIAQAARGVLPWWAASGKYLYTVEGRTLWHADYMENPLTRY